MHAVSRRIMARSALLALAFATSSHAANFSWQSSSDGLWEDPSNWNFNGTPTSTDNVSFTLNSAYTATLQEEQDINSPHFQRPPRHPPGARR